MMVGVYAYCQRVGHTHKRHPPSPPHGDSVFMSIPLLTFFTPLAPMWFSRPFLHFALTGPMVSPACRRFGSLCFLGRFALWGDTLLIGAFSSMACCKVCCGCADCTEGQEGKCCCGGSSGTCCQAGETCVDGECVPEAPCSSNADCFGYGMTCEEIVPEYPENCCDGVCKPWSCYPGALITLQFRKKVGCTAPGLSSIDEGEEFEVFVGSALGCPDSALFSSAPCLTQWTVSTGCVVSGLTFDGTVTPTCAACYEFLGWSYCRQACGGGCL